MSSTAVHEGVIGSSHHEEHHGPAKGWRRWLYSTSHKDIGTMYLIFAGIAYLIAGAFALIIRAELFQPGLQLLEPNFFNQMTTLHGFIMLIFVVVPGFTGLANWMLPMMLGAPDMALPRLNNWSFWLQPVALILILFPLFLPAGAANFGWTFYAPLSTTYAPDTLPFFVFAVHIAGVGTLMSAVNIIVTIANLRAPGLGWMDMPIFVWTMLVAAALAIIIMPVLAAAATMVLFDKFLGTSFFSAAGGGDPTLYAHIFWFFGHPEVYLLILPAFGVMSTILPTFSRKKIFGYSSMVYATCAIGVISFFVWGHHMFTIGMPAAAQYFFLITTMAIAVPTGIKIFNWILTLYRGSLTFETPMLFALGFIFMFTFGGFTGIMLSITTADYQYHDSYFVVAHFHYVLVPGAIFGIMAGVYYWLPKWTGRMYNEALGKIHFWVSFISVNVLFFPMHFVGLAGMPRRIPDYPLMFADYNMLASLGAFVYGFTQLLFFYIVWKTVKAGETLPEKSNKKAWEGAEGLEWTLPSPPPYHSFSTPPEIFKQASH